MCMSHAALPASENDLEVGEGKELVERVNTISSGDRALMYELDVLHRQLGGPKQVLSRMINVYQGIS